MYFTITLKSIICISISSDTNISEDKFIYSLKNIYVSVSLFNGISTVVGYCDKVDLSNV